MKTKPRGNRMKLMQIELFLGKQRDDFQLLFIVADTIFHLMAKLKRDIYFQSALKYCFLGHRKIIIECRFILRFKLN